MKFQFNALDKQRQAKHSSTQYVTSHGVPREEEMLVVGGLLYRVVRVVWYAKELGGLDEIEAVSIPAVEAVEVEVDDLARLWPIEQKEYSSTTIHCAWCHQVIVEDGRMYDDTFRHMVMCFNEMMNSPAAKVLRHGRGNRRIVDGIPSNRDSDT